MWVSPLNVVWAEDNAAPCPAGELDQATVAAVADDATLQLTDGRTLKLADIAIPPETRPAAARRLDRLVGTSVAFSSATKDRYGRLLAQVGGKGAAPSLGESLVRDGLAFVVPDEMEPICLDGLLVAEQSARHGRKGLWDGALRIRQADDPKLGATVGTYALVEGRVLSVGTTRTNHYLNFGHDWSLDFTVMVPVSDLGAWAPEHRDLEALKGHRIRVRGLMERWNGTLMRVWTPAQIERLD